MTRLPFLSDLDPDAGDVPPAYGELPRPRAPLPPGRTADALVLLEAEPLALDLSAPVWA